MRKRPLLQFPERDKRWPGKKDTKRWCKGVVGREHQGEWVKHEYEMTVAGTRKIIWLWNVKKCKVCGKQLEYDWKKVQNIERSPTTKSSTEEKNRGTT